MSNADSSPYCFSFMGMDGIEVFIRIIWKLLMINMVFAIKNTIKGILSYE